MKIIAQKILKNGETVTVRYPEISDAEDMMNYINEISDERTFITYQGEQLSIEEETMILEEKLKNIENHKAVMLLSYIKDKLIGIAAIELSSRTQKHIGTLGISVEKKYRGIGVGRILMTSLIEEAKKELKGLEIIQLGVFAKNSIAMNWYKKMGFIEQGRLPNGIKLENGYDDHIFMYMNV